LSSLPRDQFGFSSNIAKLEAQEDEAQKREKRNFHFQWVAATKLKTEVSFPFDGVLGNTFGVAWKGKYFPRLEELGRTNSSTYI
jgi:hypothetical protein